MPLGIKSNTTLRIIFFHLGRHILILNSNLNQFNGMVLLVLTLNSNTYYIIHLLLINDKLLTPNLNYVIFFNISTVIIYFVIIFINKK